MSTVITARRGPLAISEHNERGIAKVYAGENTAEAKRLAGLAADALAELEPAKDAALAEISGAQSDAITAVGAEGDAKIADINAANLIAQAAANQAAEMVLDAATWGPGTGITTTNTTATNVTNTYILAPVIPAGSVLTSLSLFIAASGAGAFNLMFVSRNSDGTYNLVDDLTDQVVGATGAVNLPLQKSGADYVAPVEGRIAFRRAGTTTATLNYRTGSTGVSYLATGKLTGSNVSVSAQTVLFAYKINGYLARKGESLFDRAIANGSSIALDPNTPVSFSQGERLLATGSTVSVLTAAYFDWNTAKRSGLLTSLTLPIAAAGTVQVLIMRPVGSSWRCVKSFFVTTASTGSVSFTAGTDFDTNIAIERGWRVGIALQGASLTTGPSSTGSVYIVNQPVSEGQDYSLGTPSTASISIQYTVASVAIPLASMQETMGDRMRGQTDMVYELFGGVSTPSNWTLGGWTVSDGLRSPAAGGNSVFALNSAAVRYATRATWEFKFTLAASQLIQFGFGATGETSSQYIRVNTVTQQIQICTWNGAGNAPVVKASKAVGFATAIGSVARDYTMTVRRKVNRIYITLSDNVTGERFTWSMQSNYINRLIGQPGFLFEAGTGSANDVIITYARFALDIGKDFHTLFIGDSITDGWAMSDWQMPTHAEKVENLRNKGDTFTIARFGTNTTGILADLNRLASYVTSFRYMVMFIGGNDTVQATLDTNYASIISTCQSKGGKPVICTLTPKASVAAIIAQTNTNIRTRVYGAHHYVDVSRALTLNHDMTNWDTSLVMADLVHPNEAGYAVLVSQNADGSPSGTFAAEAPFLFSDSLAGYFPMVA